MRHAFTTLIVVGALALAPSAFAGAAQAQKSAKHAASTTTTAASHAIRGVVKSMDDSSLVVTASGKKATDMTFVVNQSTTKDGAPAVGSTVSVRYRTEAGKMVATAVAVQPAAKTGKSKTSK